jgi:peptide/nickel transport system substrate-binding protein
MARKLILLFSLVLLALPTFVNIAQEPQGLPVDVPREELFVIDQIYRYGVAENYNIWLTTGSETPHRHALMHETLWYRDQETGERVYGLAVSDPQYNEDFTQMTVELREGVMWTDGTPFTADDVIFTVETLKAVPELGQSGWSAAFNQFVDSVEAVDDMTIQFNLLETNPRFHNFFETRWNGVYIMPKHIYETVEDYGAYTFPDPVVLGNYVPVQADPNGFWELYERRADPENSVAGIVTGNEGPKYVITIFYGDSTRKAIAMSRGELDVYFDADIEAFETTLDTTPTARSWYTDFPWAYPNEVSTRMFSFNYEGQPLFQNADVRWALALSLNIVELQTEYIGGVAKVTFMPNPPTQSLQVIYHDPMEEWLLDLQVDLGDGEMYNVYDPTVPEQIAAWAEEQGYTVPGTPRDVFGTGWWKYDLEAAEKLMLKAGMTKDGDQWMTPDGEPFTIDLISPPDENDAFRMANAAADMWSDFGIDVNLQGLERNVWDQNQRVGQFDVSTPWTNFALASGDAWPEIRNDHPQYIVPVGEDAATGGGDTYITAMRLNDPVLGEMIDQMAVTDPSTPESVELNTEYYKYWVENMYSITAIAFKKFVTWDERYWTGFPTAEDPNYMPLYWFHGGKFAVQNLSAAS